MNKFVKKASIVAIAAIIAVSVVAPAQTQAEVTIESLQAQISDLLVTINALTAQIAVLTGGTTGGTTPGGTTGFTFDRSLTVGSEGNDVKELQMLLNSNAATQVAASGVGSAGNETIFFGPLTRAAVIKFQDLYASEVLTPLGLSAGTGFFGSSSRAKANTLTGTGTGTGTPSVPTGPGAVNVSITGPASGTIVAGQAVATLANYTLTGSGTVTKMSFKRTGISTDATLANTFLFDGDTRLTDGASVSSDSLFNFADSNGIFTVNGVKNISVRSNILDGISGNTVGVELVSVTLSNGTVSGAPLTSNLQTITDIDLATTSIAVASASGDTAPGTDIVVFQGTLTVSTRDVLMTRLALRQIGSINTADVENFRLMIDGVEVAQTQSLDSNRYVTFSTSKTLTTGAKLVKVMADIIGGSGRTVQMSLRGTYDMTIIDTQLNANISDGGTFPFTPSAFTIDSGTLTVVKATDSPSTDIVLSGTDIALARYTFTAYGEPVKVETLLVDFVHNTSGASLETSTWRNGRILVNGSQVGSTTTLDPDGNSNEGTSFTTNFVVNPGSPATVEVRADVFDNDSTNAVTANDTMVVNLSTGVSNAIPQESLTPIAVPGSDKSANTLTVASGTLSLASDTNYGNRNVIVPQTAYKLADFDLSNTNVELVNVNTLTLTFTAGGGGTFTQADLTDVFLKYGSSTTAIKSTVSSSQAFSVTFTMAKNESKVIEVWGNILSGNVTGDATLIVNVAVTGTTGSGQAATVGATAGQTLTAKTSGTITGTLNSGSSPVAQIVSDNQTIDAAVYNFATVTDSYTITAATVTLGTATAVKNVILKNGSTVLATKPAATSVTFSGLNVAVPADNIETNLTVALELGGVGVGAGTTGSSIQVALSSATARSEATGTSASVAASGTWSGNANYVYAAIPNLSRVALPTTLLSTGTVTLAKFTVDADGGTIGWREVYFEVTKTSGTGEVTLTNATVWDGNTEVAGTDTITTLTDLDASGTIGFVATNEQQVVGSKTYTLKATSTSTALSTGDNINTTMDANLTYVAPTDQGSVGGTSTIVWSDRSAASHSTSTSDWNNDSQIDFLPLDSWTLVR